MAIDYDAVKTELRQYADDVRCVFPVDKVFIFGSYAKGTADRLSDVDVCFFIKDYNNKTRYDISMELFRLCEKNNSYIEPRVFESSEINRNNLFVNEILRTGYEI